MSKTRTKAIKAKFLKENNGVFTKSAWRAFKRAHKNDWKRQ